MIKLFELHMAENGFIFTCPSKYEEGTDSDRLYEVADGSKKKELKAITSLLYFVLDLMGYGGSQHDEYRIEIKVKKQRREG